MAGLLALCDDGIGSGVGATWPTIFSGVIRLAVEAQGIGNTERVAHQRGGIDEVAIALEGAAVGESVEDVRQLLGFETSNHRQIVGFILAAAASMIWSMPSGCWRRRESR